MCKLKHFVRLISFWKWRILLNKSRIGNACCGLFSNRSKKRLEKWVKYNSKMTYIAWTDKRDVSAYVLLLFGTHLDKSRFSEIESQQPLRNCILSRLSNAASLISRQFWKLLYPLLQECYRKIAVPRNLCALVPGTLLNLHSNTFSHLLHQLLLEGSLFLYIDKKASRIYWVLIWPMLKTILAVAVAKSPQTIKQTHSKK